MLDIELIRQRADYVKEAMQKVGDSDNEEDLIVVLEEGVGPVRVGVRLRPGSAPFAELDVPVLPEAAGEAAP